MNAWIIAEILLLAPLGLSLGAQQARTLSKPDVEHANPFSSIAGIRELKDGRVIVSDIRDGTLQVIDFRRGTATIVGRQGSGPGEYGLPLRVLSLPGDTTAVFDSRNSRYLLIGPDAKPTGEFHLELSAAGPRAPNLRPDFSAPQWTDARGRIFFQTMSFGAGGDRRKPLDSGAVLRYDRGAKKADTVAFVRRPRTDISTYSVPEPVGTGRISGWAIDDIPFDILDGWAVLPDGSVAVVRGHDYHVDFYTTSGARRSAPPAKYERLPVTEADREAVRASRRPRPNPAGSPVRDPGVPVILEPSEWPAFKSPFVRNGVWARPNGELWVERTREARDKVPKFDVFDATGRLLGTIALPAGAKLVGFGSGSAYVVRMDADDLQYLQRYTLREGAFLP